MRLRRLKLAMLEDMNDPFELLGIELKTPEDRAFFQEQLKPEMNRTIGLLCFSRKWSNPVLWSHYADKHRGLCLGFDIPDLRAKEVTYVGRRLKAETKKWGQVLQSYIGTLAAGVAPILSNRLLILCSEEVLVERSGELMPSLDPVLNA